MADAADLNSAGPQRPCGFDSHPPHCNLLLGSGPAFSNPGRLSPWFSLHVQMKDHILSIDHGTQSVRAMIFDLRGNLVSKVSLAYTLPI
jgi:hypothetical protein